jgi:hypothetical protein
MTNRILVHNTHKHQDSHYFQACDTSLDCYSELLLFKDFMHICKSIFLALLMFTGFAHASEPAEPTLPTLTTLECRAWTNEDEPMPKAVSTYIGNAISENKHIDPESVNLAFEIVDKQCARLLMPETFKK